MFQIDRTKTSLANLVALLNTGSTYAFTGSEYTVGAPSAQTPVDNTENTNSQVTLTAVDGSGFTGTKTVRYRRLAMGATKPGAATAYNVTGADTLATIKTAIAVQHNLIETDFDITGTIPAQGAGPNTFAVAASANSVLYFGTFNVTVTFP
jgi:hypothetical protein